MAEVYKGYHAALDRYVAIKLLHPFLADDPEFKDRFEKEARNVAKLRHPNIVQVFDFEYDQHGESYYMVMELINGPTLKDKLFELAASDQRYSLQESVRIISDTTNALSYAHKRNMIHRDVKPANLMLDEDGRVVLTDFGIAKIVTGVQFTASGGMVGTPAYMAPEQGLGEAGDERSDLYSVGVIMYQMVTGRLPYDADTPLAIILKHLNEPVPDLRKIEPGLPDWVIQVTAKAMEKDPEKRYQSAEEFLEDLRRGIGGRTLLGDVKTPNSAPIGDSISDSVFSTGSNPLAVINEATEQDKRRVTGSHRTVLDPNRPRAGQAPNPPTQTPRTMTTGGARNLNPTTTTGRTRLPELTPTRQKSRGCTSVAITVLFMLVLLGGILGLIITGQNGDGPLAGFFEDGDTDTPTTKIAAENASATLPVLPSSEPSITPTPSNTPTASKTSTPTNTATATATATLTATNTFTPSSTPTNTATTSASSTPTQTLLPTSEVNITRTARVQMFASQTAASIQTATAATPTLTVEELLARCDLDYAIIEPRELDTAPSLRDIVNPRLVQARREFTFELVIENASTCDWPSDAGLEFFFIRDTTALEIDYAPLTQECSSADRIFKDVNYTSPTRPRIFLEGPVKRGDSLTIPIIGLASNRYGCYFGVWQLQFADYGVPVGDPVIMPIQVFGGE